MSLHLYVYFKVPQAVAADLLPRWWHWLDTVEDTTGVAGSLLRRPGVGGDGLQTWMEVYQDVPDAFAETLDHLWSDRGLQPFLAGPRHAELFADHERPDGGG